MPPSPIPTTVDDELRSAYLRYVDTAFWLRDEALMSERRELLERRGTLFTDPLLEPVLPYPSTENPALRFSLASASQLTSVRWCVRRFSVPSTCGSIRPRPWSHPRPRRCRWPERGRDERYWLGQNGGLPAACATAARGKRAQDFGQKQHGANWWWTGFDPQWTPMRHADNQPGSRPRPGPVPDERPRRGPDHPTPQSDPRYRSRPGGRQLGSEGIPAPRLAGEMCRRGSRDRKKVAEVAASCGRGRGVRTALRDGAGATSTSPSSLTRGRARCSRGGTW